MGSSFRKPDVRLSLRTKLAGYLVLVHVTLGTVAWLVLSKNRSWLFVAEAVFVVSIVIGLVLVRALFAPLRLVRTGAELMRERDFTTHFLPVGQPELDGLIAVYNLMIDRLREERLKAEEQHSFLEKVLDASPGGVVTLDYDGRVSQLNRAAGRFLSLDREPSVPASFFGRRLHEIPDPLAQSLAALEQGDARVVSIPGGRRMKIARAVFYDHGHPRSFFVLEELTEELRATEKAAYEKLIRMITHEVNNSVGAVRSLLESLHHYAGQVGAADRPDFVEALDVAVARMNNLNGFMRGFSEVVRLPSPDLRPCDVRSLVNEILILLRPELEERRIGAAWERTEELAPVPLDKNQIEQVLVNVFKNAMESIGSDGSIGVSLAHDGPRPRLVIRDTGQGLPEQARDKLFTPFFSTKRDGRGLGLTVVREILAPHHFDYALTPVEGGGAAFQIWF
jgi:two-component system nitrogen regulation sensor histidine kinase NtrY